MTACDAAPYKQVVNRLKAPIEKRKIGDEARDIVMMTSLLVW